MPVTSREEGRAASASRTPEGDLPRINAIHVQKRVLGAFMCANRVYA
jgi:hypothetical protein